MSSRKSNRRRLQKLRVKDRPDSELGLVPALGGRRPEISRRRKWLFRLAAALLAPTLFFALLETGLRIGGYGYPTGFFVRSPTSDSYQTNRYFGRRFFPAALTRAPVECQLPRDKAEGTYRIFILGSSAAMGTPDPAFAFGRMLEGMLELRFPNAKFQVVNAAMTAINSHVVLPIARDCAGQRPDLFVIYTGNNEFVGPYGAGTVFQDYSPSLAMIRMSVGVRSTKTAQLFQNLVRRLGRDQDDRRVWKGLGMFRGHQVPPGDRRIEKVYNHFRANLAETCRVACRSGAPVILCTVGTNLKDCPPFCSTHRPDLNEDEVARWNDLVAEGTKSVLAGRHAAALEKFLAATEIDDQFAELHFRVAQCHLALGRLDPAREHFLLARDLDALRFRADSQINEVIREIGQEQADRGVHLVDAERTLAESEHSKFEIPGKELFYEHVHLNPEGNYLLAKAVFNDIVTLLPDGITEGQRGGTTAPTFAECCQRIALTSWDRCRMLQEMADMQARPPFSQQMDHRQRSRECKRELDRLEPEATSPATLGAARKTYEVALAGDPDCLPLRLNYARLLSRQGEPELAAEELRQMIEQLPGAPRWHQDLGSVLQEAKRPEEAIAQFREAMRLNPAFAATSYSNIGSVLLAQGKAAEAEQQFRQSLDLDSEMCTVRTSLGTALLQQGRFAEATEEYQRALEIDPDHVLTHTNLARALAAAGNLTEATAHCRQALQLKPAGDTYRELVALLLRQKMGHEALEICRQAADRLPPSADACYQLGRMWDSLGQSAEAAAQYRAALRLDPDHFQAGHQLGAALVALGQVSDAIQQYRQVVKRHPESALTLNNLARILATTPDAALRDGAEAVRLAELAARQSNQQNFLVLDTLAAAYAEVGRWEKAKAVQVQGIQLAQSQGKSQHASAMQERLELYRSGRPHRE